MLSLAPKDHVLVIRLNSREAAFMCELSAETLQFKGMHGALIDGGCYDTKFILKLDFPVWASHATPIDVVNQWQSENFDVPATIGERAIAKENLVRKEILQGVDPQGAYICHDKF